MVFVGDTMHDHRCHRVLHQSLGEVHFYTRVLFPFDNQVHWKLFHLQNCYHCETEGTRNTAQISFVRTLNDSECKRCLVMETSEFTSIRLLSVSVNLKLKSTEASVNNRSDSRSKDDGK